MIVMGSDKVPDGDCGDRRLTLTVLSALFSAIGSANDAEDHGHKDEAECMREESCTAIRELMTEYAFVVELFPTLERELDTGHILGFGWAELSREAEAHLESLEAAQRGRGRMACALWNMLRPF
jgi:hypothetical protein